jgi:hypothetical protein
MLTPGNREFPTITKAFRAMQGSQLARRLISGQQSIKISHEGHEVKDEEHEVLEMYLKLRALQSYFVAFVANLISYCYFGGSVLSVLSVAGLLSLGGVVGAGVGAGVGDFFSFAISAVVKFLAPTLSL